MLNCNNINQHALSRTFLYGQLSDAEQQTFIEHLDTCQPCRQSLEQTAGNDQVWQSTRDLLKQSSEIVHWSDRSLQSGSDHPFHRSSDLFSEFDSNSNTKTVIDLSILGPTDDPAYLGRIGIYEVLGAIGRGGMGIVFKAFDRSLDRNVAIKVLDPSFAGIGAARQRFAREARAMASISHEHVVPIYAVDEHRDIPFFAMEYVAGGTLEARLRSTGSLETVSIVRIALQISSALHAAHECGLVHRDIKPANILLDKGIDRVRVADFGLARIANDASYTRSGLVAGTPQFMAPEQIRGEACDARSDLFSLGSVMYAMATGHPPFRAETVYGVMHRIVQEAPRPIRQQNSNIPEWLEEFIQRLMEKERNQRFGTTAEVTSLLEQELVYLQNPSHQNVPKRDWITPKAESKSINRKRYQKTLVIATCALLAVIGISTAPLIYSWNASSPGPFALPPNSTHSDSKASPSSDEKSLSSLASSASVIPNRTIDSQSFAIPDSNSSIPDIHADRESMRMDWDENTNMHDTSRRLERLESSILERSSEEQGPWSDHAQRARQRIELLKTDLF